MFGANPLRGRESDPSRLFLTEMFYTLQGEGPFSGEPALFIRLAGCNLACTFCDTEFEKGMEKPLDVAEITERLLAFSKRQRRLVVITGGEPLRQNLRKLCEGLYALGTERIQIETAGTLWVEGLEGWIRENRLTIVCSPKTPKVHPSILHYCRDWKYIVRENDLRDPQSLLPASGTQAATQGKYAPLARPPARYNHELPDTIWLSPCDEQNSIQNRANMLLARDICLSKGYRLSLQVHKIVEVA